MPTLFLQNSEIDWLKRKVNENPASMLHARLADYYLRRKEYDLALEHAQKSVDLHPDYSSAHWVLAKCFFERQEYDKANKNLQELLKLDPQHPAALKMSCEMMRQLGDYKKVQEILRKILEIDPADQEIEKLLAEAEKKTQGYIQVTPSFTAEELPKTEEPVKSAAQIGQQDAPLLQEDTALQNETSMAWNPESFDFLKPAPVSEPPKADESAFSPPLEAEEAEQMRQEPEKPTVAESPAVFYDWLSQPSEEITSRPESPSLPWEESAPGFELSSPIPPDEEQQVASAEESAFTTSDYQFDWESIPQDVNLKNEERQFNELLEEIFRPDLETEEQQEEQEHTLIRNAADKRETEDDVLKDAFGEPFIPESGPRSIGSTEISPSHENSFEGEPPSINQQKPSQGGGLSIFEEIFTPANPAPAEFIPEEQPPAAKQGESPTRSVGFYEILAGLDIRDDTILQDAGKEEFFNDQVGAGLGTIRPPVKQEQEYPPAEDADSGPRGEIPPQTSLEQSEEKGPPRMPDKFLTPTLGEIYTSQGQYAKAIGVFEKLLKNDPQNAVYRQKLEWLRQRLQEQQISGKN